MKSILFAITLALSAAASADQIKCSFTEPFFNLELDTKAGTLKMLEPDSASPGGQIVKVLSKDAKINKLAQANAGDAVDYSRYSVTDKDTLLLTLELNYQADDGMSDYTYPYEAIFQGNFGGCHSDLVKRFIISNERP
jgi:uncharacterized membrane protein